MDTIRAMTMADYDAVVELMRATPGVSFREADSREATARYLERNPGMSFVAQHEQAIVGCIMSGHDGRRGYLQHLVVHTNHRRTGLGRALVSSCTEELARLGIFKSHIDVFQSNEAGREFWQSAGWKVRTDICRYSYISNGNADA